MGFFFFPCLKSPSMGNSGGSSTMIVLVVLMCGAVMFCLCSGVGGYLAYTSCALKDLGFAPKDCPKKEGDEKELKGLAALDKKDVYIYLAESACTYKYITGDGNACKDNWTYKAKDGKSAVYLWCKVNEYKSQKWRLEKADSKYEYFYLRLNPTKGAVSCTGIVDQKLYLTNATTDALKVDKHNGPVLAPKSGSDEQKWKFEKKGSGTYYIKNKAGGGGGYSYLSTNDGCGFFFWTTPDTAWKVVKDTAKDLPSGTC